MISVLGSEPCTRALRAGPRGVFRGLALALCALGCDANPPRAPSTNAAPNGPAPGGGVLEVCGGAAGLPAGSSEQRITSGGVERRFLVLVPPLREPAEPLPVVFNLHGSGGSPEGQLATSGLAPLAEAERFVVVAPAALNARWNVPPASESPDDVSFIGDVIDTLPRLACIDSRRVYATGFSGGGRMSSQLACDLSERFGAIAAVGGIRFPGPCSAARAIPVLAIHGTADTVNPFDGGGQPYWGTSVGDAVDGWARHNERSGPRETELAPGVWQVSFEAAARNEAGDVVLYRLDGVEHVWPASILPGNERGTTNHILWDFFQSHPLPAGG
jgi:polyhydroxybutyrate depolymerase